jgi:hypothetical protein
VDWAYKNKRLFAVFGTVKRVVFDLELAPREIGAALNANAEHHGVIRHKRISRAR